MTARGFLIGFVGAVMLVVAGLYAVLIAVDPFSRGHGLWVKPVALDSGPRTANVSRGRDAAFNAALFGNSHIQLLSPERLDALSGLKFVQLTIPATTPREQLVVLEWFALHHRETAKAVVIGADSFWCSADRALKSQHPFPFWLYEPGFADYALGLFRLQAARVVPRRIAYLLGRGKAQRADGYWDYEAYRTRDEAVLRREIAGARQQASWNETGRYPWIAQLDAALARLPAATRVVLLVPPVHAETLPQAGTAQAAAERACVAALQRIAGARPGTVLVDMRKDTPALRDPANFWDTTHYSKAVAEMIEPEIARAISGADPGK